jgi:hypothetical protein
MLRRWMPGLVSIIIALSGTAFALNTSTALGADFQPATAPNPPPGPDRYTFITVQYTAFKWSLATWKTQDPLCSIIVDHEGMPFPGEIYRDCGETIYNKWIVQEPCMSRNKRDCTGYYVFPVNNWSAEKEVPAELPPATVWISLEGCQPVLSTSTNICEVPPTLVFTGQEPLPEEAIIRVEGTYDGRSFDCDATNICKFEVPETIDEGVNVEFWSYSSYGDSSITYSAQVRVQKVDDGDPDQLYWYADVLSSQWQGQTVATCSDSWSVFPPVGGPPEWLTTPKQSEELSSDIPYTYLAENLILQGVVDASACVDGGLSPEGGVNQCGLEQSRPAVIEWQNQFDELILSTAKETAVPARLLKNIFARESQFWPGTYQGAEDAGLGQLTEDGADTTLFWNPSFYEQFCPLVFSAETCGNGYKHLTDEERAELQQALVRSVNATCEDCPLGIDLTQADYSVAVFANTMLANCEQAGQVIHNYTGVIPGDIVSYENLWKFTLVNYNAGGGCLAQAITHALGENLELTWDNVSPFLTGACSGAIDYVNDISK